jgi:hypothetical protein
LRRDTKAQRLEGEREVAMKREQVSEAWIRRRVKVKLRTESGNGYWVLGKLRGVSDEGIELSPQFRTGASESRSRPTRPRSYPWTTVSDVQPLGDR